MKGLDRLPIALFVSLSIACETPQKMTTSNAQATEPIISWSTGHCFGNCPVFDIQIDPTGKATFYPRANTESMDTNSTRLTHNEWHYVKEAFAKSEFERLDSNYMQQIADAPISTLFYNGHLVRCKGEKPIVYRVLERILERLAIKQGWLSPGLNPSNHDPSNSLIVQLTDLSETVRLIVAHPQYDLFLVKEISYAPAIILLRFSDDHSVEDVITSLSDFDSVENVEKNKKLSRR